MTDNYGVNPSGPLHPPTTRDARPATTRDGRPPTTRDLHDATTRDGQPPTHRDLGPSTTRDHHEYTSAGTAPASAIRLPDYLDRDYEVIEDLDSGGEANVAVIRHRHNGIRKVVKIYHRGITLPQGFVDKLADANSRHVLPVERSTFTGWGHPRVIELMDYLPNGPLDALLARSNGRSPELARAILAEMAAALDYIHNTLDLVHRDIKPSNILIRQREPLQLVLADLGLAAELAASRRSRRETSGGVKGTLVYQSPETLNMSDAGSPRDWWALGMMVCEVLTGQHPFKDSRGATLRDENAIRHAITMGAIDVSSVTDSRWNLLCRGLLTHKPTDRWGAQQVQAWLRGESPHVTDQRPQPSSAPRAVPPFRFAGQRFTDPAALATHLVTNWDSATALFTSRDQCDALHTWIRNDVRDTDIETNLLTPVGGATPVVDARILQFAAHYRGRDIIFRSEHFTSNDLARRYLKAGESWQSDPLLERLKPDVLAALVETQFDEQAGPAGQSADYYAFRNLSRGEQDIDRKIEAAAADIVRAANTRVGDADIGIDVRQAMPRRILQARALARAALLSPTCLSETRSTFNRLDTRRPTWFSALCSQAGRINQLTSARPGAEADTTEIAAKALAVGIADLAQHYEQARTNAEAAAEFRRQEAAAAAAQQRRDQEEAAAEAERQSERSARNSLTMLTVVSAVACVAAYFGADWLLRNVHTADGWPSTWAHWFLHLLGPQTQLNVLLFGIVASILLAIVINAAPAIRRQLQVVVYFLIGYCALCILPILGALLCYALFIAIVIGAIVFGAFVLFSMAFD